LLFIRFRVPVDSAVPVAEQAVSGQHQDISASQSGQGNSLPNIRAVFNATGGAHVRELSDDRAVKYVVSILMKVSELAVQVAVSGLIGGGNPADYDERPDSVSVSLWFRV